MLTLFSLVIFLSLISSGSQFTDRLSHTGFSMITSASATSEGGDSGNGDDDGGGGGCLDC